MILALCTPFPTPTPCPILTFVPLTSDLLPCRPVPVDELGSETQPPEPEMTLKPIVETESSQASREDELKVKGGKGDENATRLLLNCALDQERESEKKLHPSLFAASICCHHESTPFSVCHLFFFSIFIATDASSLCFFFSAGLSIMLLTSMLHLSLSL